MMYLIKKLKLLTVSLVALSFLVAVSLSSCGGSASYSEDDAEAVEAVEESADSGEEHNDGDHPEGEEDGDEHPSDSTAGDHPEGDDSSSDSDEG
jgi:hypothetical protein